MDSKPFSYCTSSSVISSFFERTLSFQTRSIGIPIGNITNYRALVRRYLADWLARPLDAIARRDVEDRFNRITANHGWSQANLTLTLLRSVYRRPCVDLEGLHNPVDLWLAAGGRFHRRVRRRISAPAEVLPCWRAGIEAAVAKPAVRDAFWFGLYTGMRVNEVLPLRWARVDIEGQVFRVEETKTGVAYSTTMKVRPVSIRVRHPASAARGACRRSGAASRSGMSAD